MKLKIVIIAAALSLVSSQSVQSQAVSSSGVGHTPAQGWFDFKKPVAADPVVQHAKETFILYGCAYCHGVDLHSRNEAADLMHSPVVGADQNGEAIAEVLKAGIPQTAKISPMPQFSDLTDKERADLARWIHYARMQGRFDELMAAKDDAKGSAAAGKAYYDETCAACHSADLRQSLKAVKPADLKARVLKPAFLETPISFDLVKRDARRDKGKARHSALLENYSEKEVADLLAYLRQAG